jgi:uncharacterized protein (TIRG00374 family)
MGPPGKGILVQQTIARNAPAISFHLPTEGAAREPASPRSPGRKRWAALALAAVLAIVLPVLAFQGVNVSKSWELILNCQAPYLAVGGLLFLATLWFRSWRWRYLLAAQQEVRLRSCVSATCVGLLANNVLPFRLGDVVRAGALGQLEKAHTARVLATVAVERILDILTLVFFLGAYLALASAGPHQAELMTAGLLALVGGMFLAGVMVVGYWRRTWLQRVFTFPARWVNPALGDKLAVMMGRFLEGLQVFAGAGQVARTVLLSLALWGASVGSYVFVGQALGLDVPPEAFIVVVFTTAFGAIIPAAPGGIGTFHSFAAMGLYLAALASAEQALAFAALLHALEWVLTNLAGLGFLWRDRLHLSSPLARREEGASLSRSERATNPEEVNHATPTIAGGEPRPTAHAQPV